MSKNPTSRPIADGLRRGTIDAAYSQLHHLAVDRGHPRRSAGATLGAAAGALAGSFVGPLGAMVGGAAGGLLGAIIGSDSDENGR